MSLLDDYFHANRISGHKRNGLNGFISNIQKLFNKLGEFFEKAEFLSEFFP